MPEIPEDLRYAETHEWARDEEGLIRVGITDYAQGELGDVVFVDLPQIGRQVTQGESCGAVESVKAVADLYAPVSGQVVEVNAALADAPELVNQEPYEGGWLVVIEPSDPRELDALLDAEAYRAHIGGQ
jgi:glycine cleavage system H protein